MTKLQLRGGDRDRNDPISHLRRAQGDKGHEDGASVSPANSEAHIPSLSSATSWWPLNGHQQRGQQIMPKGPEEPLQRSDRPRRNLAYDSETGRCRPPSSTLPIPLRQLPMTTSKAHAVLFTKDKCKPCIETKLFIGDFLDNTSLTMSCRSSRRKTTAHWLRLTTRTLPHSPDRWS